MITLSEAKTVLDAAERKAIEIKQPMNVAVVDAGARLVAFIRMDKAWIGSIDIAIDKAFTARAFDLPTKELGKLSQPKEQFYGVADTNDGHVVIFAGGIPLKRNGEIIGAIGVSGGFSDQDQAVAEAGAEAFV